MKVLITDFDIFKNIGGGQTFYRSIIEKNPQIDFYYLVSAQPIGINHPTNAHPITYQEKYHQADLLGKFADLTPQPWTHRSFVIASNIAASVASQSFDIVEVADYEQLGLFIRPALEYHQVSFARIVLSMHGCISTTIRLNWFNPGEQNIPLDLQERMQYQTVDLRYGISKTYLDEWREIVDLESHYLDPLWFMSLPQPTLTEDDTEYPSLNFIGRTEKRKGPDIFAELVWWLPHSNFSSANIIGPDSYGNNGVGSQTYLYTMANNRFANVNLLSAMSQQELAKIFASKSITFLPSRYDTFNLIALESLFSGCPTAIGSGAGVCRYLQEKFPEIPFIYIDMNNVYSCIPKIISLLENYQEYRQKLVDVLFKYQPQLFGIPSEMSLEQIYQSQPKYNHNVRTELERWYYKLMNFYEKPQLNLKSPALKIAKTNIPSKILTGFRSINSILRRDNIISSIKNQLLKNFDHDDLKIIDQGLTANSLNKSYRYLFYLSEQTKESIANKLKTTWDLGNSYRIDRGRIWGEIARLERLRGNDLVSATYQLRVMRLLGNDRFGYLDDVKNILQANGFTREAQVAQAMYADSADREERCSTLLDEAFTKNISNQKKDYEFIDDRREQPSYKVSIIVSLYNAAKKLTQFLTALQSQTLVRAGVVEVILIDSGSPDEEYKVFQQLISSLEMPIVYARSSQRETIQSAWNRGIMLSRSPYLSFLGVDETILPDCLEILAAELDADPSVDWVIGNSLVTNVNQQGNWVNDIMIYDRKDYKQDLVYLETCYLSWVGALYRRSIHERFGYYDPTFGAAGDTEFKNRVLPFIKTKFIPKTLGLFWNYPDERTTQSPKAEIEDLRAWYLHRTVAGIKYAFAKRDPQEAEELFYTSLRYRKSYCLHWSTDIEYANNLLVFLQDKLPNARVLKYADGIKKVLHAYQTLDLIPKLSRLEHISAVYQTNQILKQVEDQHYKLSNQAIEPMYKIFNDNRHEQHSFLWMTKV